jgi:hypothetical protein
VQHISSTKRKETKYIVNYGQYLLLSTLLNSVMDRDPHGNEEGIYFVRSLYFDSLDGKDFLEKEQGILHRRKIRLRCYHPDAIDYKLETKEKINKHSIKTSISFPKEKVESLLIGDYEDLLKDHLRLYDHMKSYGYRPSVIIDYEREAYISDVFNVRINFDMNIRGTRLCEHLFSGDVAMVPLIEPDKYVLEVKHDGHLPDLFVQLLSHIDLTQVSYSKYYFGMNM